MNHCEMVPLSFSEYAGLSSKAPRPPSGNDVNGVIKAC